MLRISAYRYGILRRLTQVMVIGLFLSGNLAGLRVLQGDLSSSELFGVVPLADPFALLQILATGTMVSAKALLGGMIVLLFFAVIGGRAFCGWVCPLNIVADLANGLGTGIGVRGTAPGINRNVRYWVLGLSLMLSALLGVAAFEWISPISALHRGIIFGMGMGWMPVVAVFLFDALAVRYGFCGHICPLGAFYSLVGSASLVRVRHRIDRCTRCMQCVEACPEPQVLAFVGTREGTIPSGECTNCAKCIDICTEKAMTFGIRSYGKR